jgi:hypothetical protein
MNTNQDAPAETIDALLRVPGFAAYQSAAYQSIVDIVLDGEKLRRPGLRIGELPLDFGLTEDQLNGSQEIVAVANVLALQGHPKATLIKGDRPDFTVNMPDGPLGIEHTRAYTGYQCGSEEHFYRGIQALQTDRDFRAKIGKITISLTVDRSPIDRTPVEVLEDPEPQGFMGNRDVSTMLAEIRDLADHGYFQRLTGKGRRAVDGTPALTKFRATVDVDVAASEELGGIHASVTMWKPGRLSLFEACVVNVDDKTKKAAKYPIMPDWLVIQVVAPPDVFGYDLGDHEMKTIGPFKRLFVLYPHVDGRLYLASYSADANGTIKSEIPELPPIEDPLDEDLHEWAAAVDHALEPRRFKAWLAAGSDADVPKMTSAPTQVQWYKKWLGPNPWVSCHRKGDRIQMCFSVGGDWAGKHIEELAPDDIDGAAELVWNFIFPNAKAT